MALVSLCRKAEHTSHGVGLKETDVSELLPASLIRGFSVCVNVQGKIIQMDSVVFGYVLYPY